jgi:hypothetical protein
MFFECWSGIIGWSEASDAINLLYSGQIFLYIGGHHVVVFLFINQILCNRLIRVTSIFFAIMSKVAVT